MIIPFRKWSTGSSYPAILDEDVEKTIVPVPHTTAMQDAVAREVRRAMLAREEAIKRVNERWNDTLNSTVRAVQEQRPIEETTTIPNEAVSTTDGIEEVVRSLASLTTDSGGDIDQEDLLSLREEADRDAAE